MAGEVRVRRERGGRHHRWCAVLSRVSRLLTRVNYDRVSFYLTSCSDRTEIQHREWWQKDLILNIVLKLSHLHIWQLIYLKSCGQEYQGRQKAPRMGVYMVSNSGPPLR